MNSGVTVSLCVLVGLTTSLSAWALQDKQVAQPIQIKPKQGIAPRVAPKQSIASLLMRSNKDRQEYMRMNDELRKAWEKKEPEAAAILEKNGVKAADVQQQARKAIEDLSAESSPKQLKSMTNKTVSTPAWKNATRLADHMNDLFTSSNPAWQSQLRQDLSDANPNWAHFASDQRVQAAPLTPETLNTNGVVSRTFTPPYDWIYPYNPPQERFGPMYSSAHIEQVGTDYASSSLGQNFVAPRGTHSIYVNVDNFIAHVYLRNLVLWAYGSAELKLTLKLTEGEDVIASRSLSLDSSVFVIAGYKQDVLDLTPSIDLQWSGTLHDRDLMAVELELEAWAGGGPVGTEAQATGQLDIPSIRITTSESGTP